MTLFHGIRSRFRRWHQSPLKRKLLPVLLIFVSILTISTMLSLAALDIQASVRAYIVGEGLWSKAQRDASFFLELYGRTHDEAYLEKFKQAMQVPMGYRIARLELMKPDYDEKVVYQGMLQGRTHPDDIPGAIRLFRCCSGAGKFRQALDAWAAGDEFILRLQTIAEQLAHELHSENPSVSKIEEFLTQIELVSENIHAPQDAFTLALGEGARVILFWLRLIIVCALGLLIVSGWYISSRILERIQRSEEQYRVLFDNANDAVFVFDRSNGKVLEVNRGAEKLTGKRSGDLLDATYEDFFPRTESHGADEDYPRGSRQTNMHLDAGLIPVEVGGSLSRWGMQPVYLAIVRDISERLKNERDLRISATAMDHMAEGVVITDADHRIVSVNQAFTAITGYTAPDVLQQPARYSITRRNEDNIILEQATMTGHWRGEDYHQHKTGEIYPVHSSISTVRDEHDHILHYIDVFNDISEKKLYEKRLQHLAHYDPLTQLLNRATFHDRGQQAVENAVRNKSGLALLVIDLDGFKLVNESYGHATGDYLLQTVATRIQACLRKVDLVGRLGGDEFTVLLEDIFAPDDVIKLAVKLLAVLSENIRFGDKDISTFVSIGISFFPENANNLQTLLTNADTAMFEAKNRGRNNFQIFDPEMIVNASSRLQLSGSLKYAIERGQFELYYQPCVDICDKHMAAVEVLLRWHHPELGMVSPDIFIPLAEEIGMIGSITDWVLKTACTQGMSWIRSGFVPLQIAVNISPITFWDSALSSNIQKILTETGWHAEWLCLEITETALSNQERSKSTLEELHAMGMRLAIDDFGVGYSSLSYLKHFPVQYLKIDRSFITRSVQDKSDAAITRAIIALAKSLELCVIAEGVETVEQGEFLLAEGCDEAQGFLFGKPMPAAKLEERMEHVALSGRS